MRKDESKISEYATHTRKRLGLRRRVNKAVRRAGKSKTREAMQSLGLTYNKSQAKYE